MTKSTQDCKDFLQSIASTIGASEQDTWKRTRKFKQDNLVLRDFINQDGRTLTICEHDDELTLYSLSQPMGENQDTTEEEALEPGAKYLGKKATDKDIALFISECMAADESIVDPQAVELAKNEHNWESCSYDAPITGLEFEEDGNFCELYYEDEDGYTYCLDGKDVAKVHWFFLTPCDTAYRFFVYETKSHHLYLGYNEPD